MRRVIVALNDGGRRGAFGSTCCSTRTGRLMSGSRGQSFWVLHGHVHDTLDASSATTSHSFRGGTVDLCVALAG